MATTILDCTNLLGDSVYLLRPVVEYLRKFPKECQALVSASGLAFDLFRNTLDAEGFETLPIYTSAEHARIEFPEAFLLKMDAGRSGEICHNARSEPNGRQLHISEGYARMLNIQLSSIVPPTSWQRVMPEALYPDPYILISPFSRSCSVHTTGKPNKTLEDWKWTHILTFLRRQGYPVKVLGGPADRFKQCPVPLDSYVTASSLYELELILKSAVLVISVDNGIGHIASSCSVPLISLWPKLVCIEFIAPIWSKNTVFLQMEPELAAPVAIFAGLRRFVRVMLEQRGL